MTEKRYFLHKHLRRDVIHDNLCHNWLKGEELEEHMNVQYTKYSALKKENEQLKATMQEVAELLSEEVDLFSDKATEHDINAYIELKQLDNKDAYYMAVTTKKAIKMLKGDVE